jgi:hypothetical protein
MNIITSEWTDKDWDKLTEWLNGVLKVTEVTVTFTKKDGTERVMKCTLNPELLPEVEPKAITEDKKPRKESTTSMRVFDLEKKEWRSFTIKSIKNISATLFGESKEYDGNITEL